MAGAAHVSKVVLLSELLGTDVTRSEFARNCGVTKRSHARVISISSVSTVSSCDDFPIDVDVSHTEDLGFEECEPKKPEMPQHLALPVRRTFVDFPQTRPVLRGVASEPLCELLMSDTVQPNIAKASEPVV